MDKIVENGIIGYFDILGYQSILRNNKIEDCINAIEDILLSIPDEIKQNYLGKDSKNEIEMFINEYFNTHSNIAFISDTIIFFFDLGTIQTNEMSIVIFYILYYLMHFKRLSFEKGFPMRGYIDYNSFYYNSDKNKNIIAGKTIVECHQETSKLNFSGLILSEKFYDYCKNLKSEYVDQIFERKLIERCIVDTKKGEDYRFVVNFIQDIDNVDIIQYIFESFHLHNKEINNEVMEKVKNTEKIIRHFLFSNKYRK